LELLPDLPVCNWLICDGCTNLTHVSIPAKCYMLCDDSPIANYNDDLYLHYIAERSKIITESIGKSHNYEQGVVGMIMEYI
jgi:hypothetical protein